MGAAETSKVALEAIRPSLSGRRKEVLNALKEIEPASNEMLAEYLDLPINRVTGRVTELSETGHVEIAYVGKNKTGHAAKFWKLAERDESDLAEIKEEDCG